MVEVPDEQDQDASDQVVSAVYGGAAGGRMTLPPPEDAHTFVLAADATVTAVVVTALVVLKTILVSDRSKVEAALIDDGTRQMFVNILALLDSADVIGDSSVLKIAGGVSIEGLQFLSREQPHWFLESAHSEPPLAALPAFSPSSSLVN